MTAAPMSPARRGVIIAASIGTAIMILGLMVALIGRDSTDLVSTQPAAQEEILLEPVSFTGADPFTGTVAEGPSVPGPILPGTTTPETFQLPPAPVGSIPTIRGGEVGLFGGSLRRGSCDREKLVRFLERNPRKAAAWVAALNSDPTLSWSGGSRVRVDQIRDYVYELTPMILRTDTRVTNHGYRNGRPYRIQSVLQAGTAVLVDYYGVPRVKCYCGNPLLPPYSAPRVYKGDKWDDFDEDDVGYVSPETTIIDVFVLEDVETGQLFRRPAGSAGGGDRPGVRDEPTAPPPPPPPTGQPTVAPPPPPPGGLGTGDVQVTLVWATGDDLDLHVIDPHGDEIYFQNPTSPSGGQLDVDNTGGCGSNVDRVENVFWPEDGAPSGQYSAFVRSFQSCGGTVSFRLRVLVDGEVVHDEIDSVDPGADAGHVQFSR